MNNLNILLSKRNSIYGVCAIWIVLFHVFRNISMPYIPIVTNVIGIGNIAVDIFIFLSGLCLSLSVKDRHFIEDGWKTYFKERMVRILPSYMIICSPYYIWSAVFEHDGGILHKVLIFGANFSSATFWLKGTQTTWYVYGIIVFYILFPLIYQFAIHNSKERRAILLILMALFAVMTSYIPILSNSMILWARLPIFTIGVFAGVKEDQFKVTRIQITFSLSLLLILGTVISISELSDTFMIPQIYRLLLYAPMTLALINILSCTGRSRVILEILGGVSLEIYLVHITLLHPIKYYGLISILGYWLYLVLPVVATLVSLVVMKIEKLII